MKNKKNLIIIVIISLILIISIIIGLKIFNIQTIGNNSNKIATGIFDYQKTIDEKIEKLSKDKNITLKNAEMLLNPYKTSPLTALIIFYTENKEKVVLQINDKEKIELSPTNNHLIPVYGLTPNYDNKVKVIVGNDEKIFSIKTDKLNESFPSITVTKETNINNHFYLASDMIYSYAFDSKGNVRWFFDIKGLINPTILDNGHILLNDKDSIIEIDLLGKIYNEYRSIYQYHGEAILKDNNIIIPVSNFLSERENDLIIEMNSSGKIIGKFDLYEIVSEIDAVFANALKNDWADNRSVYYDDKTNSLIVSLRNRNSVISIDYSSHKINWIFGNIKNWSNNFEMYILNNPQNLDYPNGITNAFIDENGNLGIYNNNFDTTIYNEDSPCSEMSNLKSFAALYKVENKEISKVWEYNHNKSMFSYENSNFKIINKNKLILSSENIIVDNSLSCTIFNNASGASVIELDENDNLLFVASVNKYIITINKINVFAEQAMKISLESAKRFTDSLNFEFEKKDLTDAVNSLKNAEKIKLSYNVDSNNLMLNAFFPEDIEAKLVLLKDDNMGFIFNIKKANQNAITTIPINDLKGKYHIYLKMADIYYDTEEDIEF